MIRNSIFSFILWSINENVKDKISKASFNTEYFDSNPKKLMIVNNTISSSIATFVGATVTTPLDVIKTRI